MPQLVGVNLWQPADVAIFGVSPGTRARAGAGDRAGGPRHEQNEPNGWRHGKSIMMASASLRFTQTA